MTTEPIDNLTISTGGLARLLGVTPQRLGQLVQAGVLRKVGRGRYRLGQAVTAYIGFLRDQPAGGGALDYREMRSRLAKLQGDVIEVELAKVRGEMVSIDDAVRPFGEQCQLIRGKFLGLASRLSPRIAGCDVQSMHAAIYAEAVAILSELTCDVDVALKADEGKK